MCENKIEKYCKILIRIYGDPTGIRTPVTAVKGRCPRPLDDRVVVRSRYNRDNDASCQRLLFKKMFKCLFNRHLIRKTFYFEVKNKKGEYFENIHLKNKFYYDFLL